MIEGMFDVINVTFRFTGNHTAELLVEDHHSIRVESFQVYIVLGGSDLRVSLDLASCLPTPLTTMRLRHPQSGFVSSIRLDERSQPSVSSGEGTKRLHAIPASPDDLARFLLLLRNAGERLPDIHAGQTPP